MISTGREILPQAARWYSTFVRMTLQEPATRAGAAAWGAGRLAAWAEMAAAPGDEHAPDDRAAAETGAAMTVIDAVAALVAARISLGVDKIGDG